MRFFKHSLSPLFFTFCLLFILVSCDVNDSNKYEKIYSYKIKKDATIALDTTNRQIASDSLLTIVNFTVEEGNSTVFIYNYKSIPPEGIADAGFSEEMVFQIPADANKFEYTEDELAEARTYYRFSCYCTGAGIGYNATEGVIKGKQLNPFQWLIQADVLYKGLRDTVRVQFETRFTVNN